MGNNAQSVNAYTYSAGVHWKTATPLRTFNHDTTRTASSPASA